MSYPQRIYVLPARQEMQQQPRSVVKRAPAPRTVAKRPVPTEQLVAELLGEDFGPTGPRKRERLNHLTQEEKMNRRKMKNRVAAQNARDKKKERSAKIEDVVHDLVEENRRLRAENESLRRANEELMLERDQNRYQQQPEPVYTNNENDANIYTNVVYEEEVVGDVEDRAFESAAFINAPLPREQARSSHRTRHTNSNKMTLSMDSFMTILSFLSNQMDPNGKKTSTSTASCNISRARLESLIDSWQSTLKKDETATRPLHRLALSVHLQKRVKQFRRVP